MCLINSFTHHIKSLADKACLSASKQLFNASIVLSSSVVLQPQIFAWNLLIMIPLNGGIHLTICDIKTGDQYCFHAQCYNCIYQWVDISSQPAIIKSILSSLALTVTLYGHIATSASLMQKCGNQWGSENRCRMTLQGAFDVLQALQIIRHWAPIVTLSSWQYGPKVWHPLCYENQWGIVHCLCQFLYVVYLFIYEHHCWLFTISIPFLFSFVCLKIFFCFYFFRLVCGSRGSTLIINLPGSTKGSSVRVWVYSYLNILSAKLILLKPPHFTNKVWKTLAASFAIVLKKQYMNN